MTDVIAILQAVGYGAGAAAFAALVGFAKSHFNRDNPEPFDGEKLTSTILLGAVLGGVAGGLGIPVVDAQNLLVSVGVFGAVVYFVDAGAKAIWRFVRRRLGR